ncbi:hypothetical protein N431DRAFT_414971 [Stipitochalara longipes BDJ]|nr:hypothetical protein N431DRAFT_414971 [Stipitochalara longipes BDJ]
MPICLDSKKAQKRMRDYAAAVARISPNRDILAGLVWAVTEEQKQDAIARGLAWGNSSKAMRIVRPEETKSSPFMSGGWETSGWLAPVSETPKQVDEKKDPNVWVDTTPPKTDEQLIKERVDKNLVGWPWKGTPSKLIAIAPYTFNENAHFELPTEAQTASDLFTKLFGNAIILEKICHYLFQNHDAAWKFSVTCKEAWRIMRWNIDTWDLTEGFFHNCEKPRFVDVAPKDPFDQGSVAPIVMVTPVRREKGPASHGEQIQNLHKLCVSVNNFADYFQNLQLHRVPFLTTELLGLLIPKMRNLKILGVYKCQLIHVGETMKLLDVIKRDKPLERENKVSLDFYPNFHLGPADELGSPYCVGAYGVTWDNWNFDTTRAVWCLVLQIIPKARSQGIDFESKHTMFRQWLEKGPCHEIEETIKTFMTPPELTNNHAENKKNNRDYLKKVAAMVNYRRTGGDVRMLEQHNRPGGPPAGKIKQKRLGEGQIDPTFWAIKSHRCTNCKESLMGIFFLYTHIHEKEIGLSSALPCAGCLLTSVLREEDDHYKQEKRQIVRSWLNGPQGLNRDDLGKALADYHHRQILLLAKKLGDQHVEDSTTGPDPYDRELDERQKPLTKHEKNGKMGMHRRSPQIYESGPGTGYDYIRLERYDGHGMW